MLRWAGDGGMIRLSLRLSVKVGDKLKKKSERRGGERTRSLDDLDDERVEGLERRRAEWRKRGSAAVHPESKRRVRVKRSRQEETEI